MTDFGATPPASRNRAGKARGIALGFGAVVLATTALGAGMFLRFEQRPSPQRTASVAATSRSTARAPMPRVVAPPVRPAERVRHAASAAHPAAAPSHPRLLEPPRLAEASIFAQSTPMRVAAFEPTEAPPADPALASPAPVRIAVVEAKPAGEAFGPALPPKNAEEALEAALVPTPRARPSYRTIMAAPPPPNAARPAPLLAYARPDAGMENDDIAPSRPGLFRSPSAGNGVAIYDIGAATVYMPNGERLEAHSGLGSLRDDARFVHVKMRGATPPHTYDLKLRESLFHGVQAIRLTPVGGERRIYNRVGLLAHTYMLGKRGDSNGCVSFKDYNRFLAAFRRGEVKRLVVVRHMDPVSRIASLFRAKS